MLKFVKNAFSVHLEIVLWLNLIMCTISGGIIGNAITKIIKTIGEFINTSDNDYTLLGIAIGFIFGLLVNIILGGYIATIINMDKKIEQIAENNSKEKNAAVLKNK